MKNLFKVLEGYSTGDENNLTKTCIFLSFWRPVSTVSSKCLSWKLSFLPESKSLKQNKNFIQYLRSQQNTNRMHKC